MKRVLVVANLLHASPRIPGIAGYLPEFGWEAVILTPQGTNQKELLGFPDCFNDRVTVAETPFRGDVFRFWRRIAGAMGLDTDQSVTEQLKHLAGITGARSFLDTARHGYHAVFAYPDTERLWTADALKTARRLLSDEHWDAIVSSSPHPTSHVIASALQAEFDLPWIADFRDPWTDNHNYPFGRTRKKLERNHEVRTLRRAAAVTTVTAEAARRQSRLYSRNVNVICNGFDPEIVNTPPAPLTEQFTITYTGSIYPGKQDPEKILAAIAALTDSGTVPASEISVRFFGPRSSWLEGLIGKYSLTGLVRQPGKVLRRDAVARQRESHFLLLLDWEDQEAAKMPSSTKFFEYLAARRPILLTGGAPDTELKRLLKQTGAGVAASSAAEIQSAISEMYLRQHSKSAFHHEGNGAEIEKFSYRELGKQFSEVLSAQAK